MRSPPFAAVSSVLQLVQHVDLVGVVKYTEI